VVWAGVLIVVIRAATAAGRGEMYQLPRWLRMTSGPAPLNLGRAGVSR
jgi:hypothetical protein